MKILTLNNLNFKQNENLLLDNKLSSILDGDFFELLLTFLSYITPDINSSGNSQVLNNYNLENLQVLNNFKLNHFKQASLKEQLSETFNPLIKEENSFEEEESTSNTVENILWSLFTILTSTLDTNISEKNYPLEPDIENFFRFLREKIVPLGPFILKSNTLGNEKILNEIFTEFVKKLELSEGAKNFLLDFTKELTGKIQITLTAKNVSLAENFEKRPLNSFTEKNTFFQNFQNQNLKEIFASTFEENKGDKIPMGFMREDNQKSFEVKTYFSPRELAFQNNNFQGENKENLREIFRDTLLKFKEDFQKLPLKTQEELRNFFEKLSEREIKGIFENQKISYLKVKELSFKEFYLNQSLFNYGEISKVPEWKNVESPQGQIPLNSKKLHIEALPNFIRDFVVEISPKGERKALVQLEPPELGKMELNIKVQDKEVEIHLKVEKPETLNHFNQELSQIRQQLEELGFKLRDFQLSLGLSTYERKENAEREGRKAEREVKKDNTEKIGIRNFPNEIPYYHKGLLYRIV